MQAGIKFSMAKRYFVHLNAEQLLKLTFNILRNSLDDVILDVKTKHLKNY